MFAGRNMLFVIGAAGSSPPPSGTASLTVTWDDNSAIEDGFRVRYRTAGSGSYTLATTTAANIETATITGLAFGTNYDVTVAAFNGSGEYSTVGPITRYTPPQYAPTSLAATATLSTSIAVGFTAAAGISKYQGYYRATGSSTWLEGPAIASGTGINFTGLTSSTAYQFMVRGYLENTAPQTPSYSPDSSTLSATTIASGVFTGYDNQQFTTGTAPAGYSFVEYGGTSPTVTWGDIYSSPAFVARSNSDSCRVVAPTHAAADEAHYSFEALVNSPSGYTPLVYVPGIASVIMGTDYMRILTWSENTGWGGGSGTIVTETPTAEFSSFGVTRTYWIDYIKGTGGGDTLFRISWSTTGIKPTSFTTANSLTYMSSITAQSTGLVFHVAPTAETAATYINGSIYSL